MKITLCYKNILLTHGDYVPVPNIMVPAIYVGIDGFREGMKMWV